MGTDTDGDKGVNFCFVSQKPYHGGHGHKRRRRIQFCYVSESLTTKGTDTDRGDDLHLVHGKVTNGILLSPVLLVRGDLGCSRMLLVADGYHRICASEHFSENFDIPCKIADVP